MKSNRRSGKTNAKRIEHNLVCFVQGKAVVGVAVQQEAQAILSVFKPGIEKARLKRTHMKIEVGHIERVLIAAAKEDETAWPTYVGPCVKKQRAAFDQLDELDEKRAALRQSLREIGEGLGAHALENFDGTYPQVRCIGAGASLVVTFIEVIGKVSPNTFARSSH